MGLGFRFQVLRQLREVSGIRVMGLGLRFRVEIAGLMWVQVLGI